MVTEQVGDTTLGTREATGRLTGDGASSSAWIDDGVVAGIRGHPGIRVVHRMTLGTGRFFFPLLFLFFSLDHRFWGVSTALMWIAVVGRTDFCPHCRCRLVVRCLSSRCEMQGAMLAGEL